MMNKSINKDIKHWYNVWKIPFHIDTPDYCLYIFDKTGNTMVLSYSGCSNYDIWYIIQELKNK